MASTFNGSVANLVDPLTTSPLNSPSHAGQHTEINDALQTLAIYTAFTPTWTNLTVGNGTNNFRYFQAGKFVHLHGNFTFGSTTSVTGQIEMGVPVNAVATTVEPKPGIALQDSGTNTYYGFGIFVTAVTKLTLYVYNVSGTYLTATAVNATAPHTWANTDVIYVDLVYEAA